MCDCKFSPCKLQKKKKKKKKWICCCWPQTAGDSPWGSVFFTCSQRAALVFSTAEPENTERLIVSAPSHHAPGVFAALKAVTLWRLLPIQNSNWGFFFFVALELWAGTLCCPSQQAWRQSGRSWPFTSQGFSPVFLNTWCYASGSLQSGFFSSFFFPPSNFRLFKSLPFCAASTFFLFKSLPHSPNLSQKFMVFGLDFYECACECPWIFNRARNARAANISPRANCRVLNLHLHHLL